MRFKLIHFLYYYENPTNNSKVKHFPLEILTSEKILHNNYTN